MIAAMAAMLLLAAFQVAVQAKPAQAWEVRITITGAGQVTETTPANLVGSNCVSPSTTPTGTTGKTCLAGTPTGPYGNLWEVDYVATPASGYTFKRWESDGTTRTAIICDRSSPAATTSTYTGPVCKFRTIDNMQTRAVFADEQNPTMASLTGPTSTVGGSANFEFSANADPTFRRFECRVASVHDWQTCTSPQTEDPSASGTYTFEVRAVDWSNRQSSIMSRSWTVDKTAPIASINSGPLASSIVNNNSPSFGFSANEAATFQCRLDSGTFTACTGSNSHSYSGLSDGSHTFYVRAIDSVGNIGSATSRTWTIDTVAPNTTLVSNVGPAPGSTTKENDPVFQFSSSEANSTFECNLTGPGLSNTAFGDCNVPSNTQTTKSYTSLPDGTYTFKVRAKDQATNVDASPAQRTWTIDNIAPSPPAISSPTSGVTLATSNFTISGTAEANSHVELFDQGTSKGTTTANSSGNWSMDLSGVADGSHTYTVKATDAANNTSNASAATTVTVDAMDPTVTKWTPTGKRVSAGANAVAFFSEAMNLTTVEAPGTFMLTKKGTTRALGATVTYIETTTSTGTTYKAVLNPTNKLRFGVTYVAKLTPAATDAAGNPLVAKTWTFTIKP